MQQQEPVKSNAFINRFISVLMTILTFCVTGILAVIFRMHTDFARMQERDIEKEKKMDNIQLHINQMRLEQQAQKENAIRLDGKIDFLLQQQKK